MPSGQDNSYWISASPSPTSSDQSSSASSISSPGTSHVTVSPGGICRERRATGRWGYHPSALTPPRNHPVWSPSFRTVNSNVVVLSSGTGSGTRHSSSDSEGNGVARCPRSRSSGRHSPSGQTSAASLASPVSGSSKTTQPDPFSLEYWSLPDPSDWRAGIRSHVLGVCSAPSNRKARDDREGGGPETTETARTRYWRSLAANSR